MGVLFAFLALVGWGIGDFLIQRSTRRFGSGIALFFITAFASIVLFPFVFHELFFLADPKNLFILLITSVVLLVASLFNFEALRIGKIAVIEPVYAFEIPITAALSWFLIKEDLSMPQILLIFFIILGIFLVSIKKFSFFKKFHLERGVWLAVLTTICMAGTNFLFGISARETSPLFINWFTSTFIVIAVFLYLIFTNRLNDLSKCWREEKRLIFSVGFFDNLAWVAYAAATVFIPIAVAIGISESYIALAAILGLVLNKEKLYRHQKIGLAVTITACICLAFISG